MMDSTAQEYAEKNEYNFKLLDAAPEIPPATTTVTESIEITKETTAAVVTELHEVTTEPANTQILPQTILIRLNMNVVTLMVTER